jgi:hypothetical protein
MTSEKAYQLEARIDRLYTDPGVLYGPWTAFNPLSNSWSVKAPYTAAWVRAAPGNMGMISLYISAGTQTDGTTVGTIPAADADGNNLRPAQGVRIPVETDSQRIQAGSNNEGAVLVLDTAGNLKCYGIANAATEIGVACGLYPLDAM